MWNEAPVALKKLKSKEMMSQFKTEAKFLQQLSHPYVVQVCHLHIFTVIVSWHF